MAKRWTLTVRNGSQVKRARFDSPDASIEAMKRELTALADGLGAETIRIFKRQFDPSRQVMARAEISGPGSLWSGCYGGVDLRGDGSAEAYTGRVRRSLVKLEPGESPYDGLRRALLRQSASR